MTAAAGAHHNFANAVFRVRIAFGILRRETLVGMFVPRKDQIGMRVVQSPARMRSIPDARRV